MCEQVVIGLTEARQDKVYLCVEVVGSEERSPAPKDGVRC